MKVYRLLLLILSLSISLPAPALELDLAREVATTTIIGDWLQTREIAKHPESFQEVQIHKVIGIHPSKASVNWYFASKVAVHYAVNYYLVATRSEKLRDWYNGFTIIGGIDILNHNYNVGIRVRF